MSYIYIILIRGKKERKTIMQTKRYSTMTEYELKTEIAALS